MTHRQRVLSRQHRPKKAIQPTMTRFLLSLTPLEYQRARRVAREEGLSFAALARAAVHRYLQHAYADKPATVSGDAVPPPTLPSVTSTLRLPNELHRRLQEEARRKRTSLAAVIRDKLQQAVTDGEVTDR